MLQRYNIFPNHHHPSLFFYIGMEIPYIPSQHTKFASSNKKFSILNSQFSTVNSLTPKKILNYQLSIINYHHDYHSTKDERSLRLLQQDVFRRQDGKTKVKHRSFHLLFGTDILHP